MAMAAMDSVLDLVGNTPLVRLNKVPQSLGITATVFAKLEYYNPGGSVKDRIAYRMVVEAERSGRIRPGDTLIEPTSGNTGIGLAVVACVRGYRAIITMPEKMSAEKVAILRALNATIVRTPDAAAYDSPESHIGVAKRLQKEIPNAHILDQYANIDNSKAHELGTAEEIFRQTNGKVDVVVAGAGTGGTITGLARGLRRHNPDVKIIAADPQGSILALPKELNEKHANQPYKVEGIGYDFVPDVLDRTLVDRWYKTDDRESFTLARRLISEEGLLVGASSGSAMVALLQANKSAQLEDGAVVVVVLPDSSRNYLSKFIDNSWLALNNVLPPDFVERESLAPSSPTAKMAPTFENATVRSLQLKPLETIVSDSRCRDAVEVMRQRGFDQLPVLGSPGGRLVGLLTLGNVLSRINHGQATLEDSVSKVMFDFARINEITANPRNLVPLDSISSSNGASSKDHNHSAQRRKKFLEITKDTPLELLNQFFEWNSAAIVTERDEKGNIKPLAVATKVDLLTWLLKT